MNTEAGDGARTHDPQLGKLMLYQLSYARVVASILAAVAQIVRADDEAHAGLSYTRSTA